MESKSHVFKILIDNYLGKYRMTDEEYFNMSKFLYYLKFSPHLMNQQERIDFLEDFNLFSQRMDPSFKEYYDSYLVYYMTHEFQDIINGLRPPLTEEELNYHNKFVKSFKDSPQELSQLHKDIFQRFLDNYSSNKEVIDFLNYLYYYIEDREDMKVEENLYKDYKEYKECNKKDEEENVIDLENIYLPEAFREFSINNLFFGEEKLYEEFHSWYREKQDKISGLKTRKMKLEEYNPTEKYQTIINSKAPANKDEALIVFKDINKNIEKYIIGIISNVLRPYIYKAIEMMNGVMGKYGKFIISGGEAFNFNVVKSVRKITPDIDTKFIPYFDIINSLPFNPSSDEINVNTPETYSNFLLSLNEMWYVAMEQILNYLSSSYRESIYASLLKLESIPEFRMLKVKFKVPDDKNFVFKKRFNIFDKKITFPGDNDNSVFFTVPLFSFDMELENYLKTETDITEIEMNRITQDEIDDDVKMDKMEDIDIILDNPDLLIDKDMIYSKKLVSSTSLMGILDCPFIKPNENGYEIGFPKNHVEITSKFKNCVYKLNYASHLYLDEDIDRMIILKLRLKKAEKDKYRQKIIKDSTKLINFLCSEKLERLEKCDIGSKRRVSVKKCDIRDSYKNCRITFMSLGNILNMCAAPKYVINDGKIVEQEDGIIDKNYLDRKCCDIYVFDDKGNSYQRISEMPLFAYYSYENNKWVMIDEIIDFNDSDLYINPGIRYRFDKNYFRWRKNKEIGSVVKFDTDNIIHHIITFLTRLKHEYDRCDKTKEDQILLSNNLGKMFLFYNKELINHDLVPFTVLVNLIRMFTLGLADHYYYGASGDIIEKLLVDLRDGIPSVSEPPPPISGIPSIYNLLQFFPFQINTIDKIKKESIYVNTSRKKDRKIPRDLYKIDIIPPNQDAFLYAESFYKDIESNLTPYEKSMLTNYTTSSMTLNRKMRNNKVDQTFNFSERCMYNTLLKTFKKAKRIDRPFIVYRGLKGENIDIDYIRQLYKNGYADFQITSVSIAPPVAYNFVRGFECCMLKIYLYNVQAIYLEQVTAEQFKNEYELILPPGVIFYYIGDSYETITEDGEDIGKIHLVECLAAQFDEVNHDLFLQTFLPKVKRNILLTDEELEKCDKNDKKYLKKKSK